MRLLIFFSILVGLVNPIRAQLYFGVYDDTKPIEYWKNASLEESKDSVLNFGLTNHTYIVRFQVEKSNNNVVFIQNPILDHVEMIQIIGDSIFGYTAGEEGCSEGVRSGISGLYIPLNNHSEKSTVFIIARSADQLLIPLRISNYERIENKNYLQASLFLVYLGVVLAMLFYNLFIYFSVRDKVYLYYIFYIFTVGFSQLILFGFSSIYLFQNQGKLNVLLDSLIPALSGLATIYFAQNFIQTKKYSPIVHKILNGLKILYFVALTLSLFNFGHYVQIILNVGASSAIILVFASIRAIRAGYRPARYFIASWTIFIIGLTLYALRNFGLLPFNNFTNFALPVGSVVEILLLSFALADRINVLKQEKELSQQQAFLAIQENEKLVREQNIQLERKVHERTVDLESRNNELNQALLDLRTTQKQLAESDKMASIGQMTAGIAHEMNNPINFVQSNVVPLKRDIDDILDLIADANALDVNEQLPAKIETLKKKYKEYDIDFVKEEVVQLLAGIEDGAKRTAEIVRGLRVFSRMDRNELVSADINECLYSTLVVMKNMTKAEVTLNVDLGDNIPKIDCYPGKLSQVFMNLVTNAVQATRIDGRQPKDRIINVKSFMQDNRICVTIEDNGTGIPEDLQQKIFEPFFTTKGVGEGTGLGLSIVAGIIGDHKGAISFESISGKGTTFLVTLPVTN